jgi:hypothetical protein
MGRNDDHHRGLRGSVPCHSDRASHGSRGDDPWRRPVLQISEMNERLERIDGLLAASLVEIAELLGVSKQRPYQMSTSPGSLRRLNANGRSRLWSRREVTAWAKTWRAQKP